MNKGIFAAAAIAAAALLLASCVTDNTPAGIAARDQQAIARGTSAWNQKAPSAARPYWNEIEDKTTRATLDELCRCVRCRLETPGRGAV